jgi:hypothetical protein
VPYDGDMSAQAKQGDPVQGAVALVCSFLGKKNGGGTARTKSREDLATFLHWMLQDSRVAPTNPSAEASNRRSRCGVCKVQQRKCMETCAYAPYFAGDKMT